MRLNFSPLIPRKDPTKMHNNQLNGPHFSNQLFKINAHKLIFIKKALYFLKSPDDLDSLL